MALAKATPEAACTASPVPPAPPFCPPQVTETMQQETFRPRTRRRCLRSPSLPGCLEHMSRIPSEPRGFLTTRGESGRTHLSPGCSEHQISLPMGRVLILRSGHSTGWSILQRRLKSVDMGMAEKTNRWSTDFSEVQVLHLSSQGDKIYCGDTRVRGVKFPAQCGTEQMLKKAT